MDCGVANPRSSERKKNLLPVVPGANRSGRQAGSRSVKTILCAACEPVNLCCQNAAELVGQCPGRVKRTFAHYTGTLAATQEAVRLRPAVCGRPEPLPVSPPEERSWSRA